jgi:hypothetical protein
LLRETQHLAQGPNLVWLKVTVLLLAPALADTAQDRKDALHHAGFSPYMGEPFRPAAFLRTRPFGEMRGAHLLPMPCWDFAVVHTCLGILAATAARVGKGVLRVVE